MPGVRSVAVKPPALTLITDTSRYTGEAFFSTVEKALAAGVDAVLLREKQLDSARLLAMASRLRKMTQAYGAALLIHTQADIAEAVNADGVHLSARDTGAIPSVRNWLNDPSKRVSASCHNAQELLLAAQAGADYAMLSPLFPTPTHPGCSCLGITAFHHLARQAELPVVALGGVTVDTVEALNWPHIAVISAIFASEDVTESTRMLLKYGA